MLSSAERRDFAERHPRLYGLVHLGHRAVVLAVDEANEFIAEPTISRRTALKAVALLALGIVGDQMYLEDGVRGTLVDESSAEFVSTPEIVQPPGKLTDILVNPDKFGQFVTDHLQDSLAISEVPNAPMSYEVLLSIAMHESDSGTSELAQNANNFFGVVAKDGWTGEVYEKTTHEEIAADKLEEFRIAHPDLVVVKTLENGNLDVTYVRPFRKYASEKDSFSDFIAKVYYKNTDGAYRYADVVAYIQAGGRNPYTVIELMSDADEAGEAAWATDSEWRIGVAKYISVVRSITDVASVSLDPEADKNIAIPEPIAPEATLPEIQTEVLISGIDFSGITDEARPESAAALVKTMETAFAALSVEGYKDFLAHGITDKSGYARSTVNGLGGNYDTVYRGPITLKYLVFHLWANGVQNGGITGTSHQATLTNLIESWASSDSQSSVGYLLSDNPEQELWQLTESVFGGTNHVGNGIMDPKGKETHPDVNNKNSSGIEVQADSIYDVSDVQFMTMVYWGIAMLSEAKLIKQGMSREEVNAAIDNAVIGHGKNGGYEFGYQYTRPLISAMQQFAFIAVCS